jgi:hypothetical protein
MLIFLSIKNRGTVEPTKGNLLLRGRGGSQLFNISKQAFSIVMLKTVENKVISAPPSERAC